MPAIHQESNRLGILAFYRQRFLIGLLFVGLVCGARVSMAGESEIPLGHHSWGNFEKGAWQLVRITTDTLDDEGNITSTTVTDKQTTLVRLGDQSVKLKINVTVNVGGKKFQAPEQVMVEGVHGEPEGQTQVAKVLGPEVALIDGQKILCQVHQFEINDPEEARVVKLFHSPDVAPHVLRRETVTTKLKGRRTVYRTTTQVVQLDGKKDVLDEEHTTSLVETVRQNNKGTTITESVHSRDIPGGLVAYQAEERDAEGQLVRQSRMELVDYGLSKDEKRRGRRSRRSRRRSK